MNRSIFLLTNLFLSLVLIQAVTAAEYDFNESWERVAALADSAQYEAANQVVVEILLTLLASMESTKAEVA